jgi:hypothetical protein
MVLLSMVAPSMAEAITTAAEAEVLEVVWGVDIGAGGRGWSVEDDSGPAWLLLWVDIGAARALQAAAASSWRGLGWRRARLASLDAADRALLPDTDRERLDAATA